MKSRAITIKKRLIGRSITQADIARQLDVSTCAVNRVINRGERSFRIEKLITELTGYQFDEVKRKRVG